jgi:hypothetical protein
MVSRSQPIASRRSRPTTCERVRMNETNGSRARASLSPSADQLINLGSICNGRVKLGMRRLMFECSMPETNRLSEPTEWIDLEFVERQRTPEFAIQVGIQLHLAGLSLSNTKQHLEKLGVKRSRTAIHDWVRKADLQPDSDVSPNQIAVDETVFESTASATGCTLRSTPKRINSFTYGCFRRVQRNSPCCFFVNSVRNSSSQTPRF